jgi:hypothetical protein
VCICCSQCGAAGPLLALGCNGGRMDCHRLLQSLGLLQCWYLFGCRSGLRVEQVLVVVLLL